MRDQILLGYFPVTVVFRGKRIRLALRPGPALASRQNLALAAASLLMPCALLTFTLTCWSMAADLNWTSSFFLAHGVLSHWQSWLLLSSLLLLLSRVLSQIASQNE